MAKRKGWQELIRRRHRCGRLQRAAVERRSGEEEGATGGGSCGSDVEGDTEGESNAVGERL